MATYMYTFDYIKISGTDPYEFFSSFVEPSRAIPHFSTTGTFEIDLDTGECGIVQTYDDDSKETIYYILSDINFKSSIFFNSVSFSNWDSEKTLLKNRFGFPILDTEDEAMGVLYTMADFDTIITDSVDTFIEQGSSSELPVLIRNLQTTRTVTNSVSNVQMSKSENNPRTTSANGFLSGTRKLEDVNMSLNNSVAPSSMASTTSTGGY